MRKRARTDLCGGRSVMIVPTATVIAALLVKGKPEMFVLASTCTAIVDAELNGRSCLSLLPR